MFASARAVELDEDRHSALICGPVSSGKTSLLFHIACQAASAGHQVLFLTDKNRLYQKPPFSCQALHGTNVAGGARRQASPFASSNYLERIQMKYFEAASKESKRRVIEFFCHLHTSKTVFHLIVIDNFDSYFPMTSSWPEANRSVACALALIENARAHMSSLLQANAGGSKLCCHVAVGVTSEKEIEPQAKNIFMRTVTDIYQIVRCSSAGEGAGSEEDRVFTMAPVLGQGVWNHPSTVARYFKPSSVNMSVNEEFIPYGLSVASADQVERGPSHVAKGLRYKLSPKSKALTFEK